MSDDALPLCACEQYYDSHHPECPARRAYEALLLKLETSQVALKGAEERAKMLLDAKSHWAERARTAESRLGRLQDWIQERADEDCVTLAGRYECE